MLHSLIEYQILCKLKTASDLSGAAFIEAFLEGQFVFLRGNDWSGKEKEDSL